ncbi:MAG: hypothetical protein DELT_02079 [Desulfovibrio sp.]
MFESMQLPKLPPMEVLVPCGLAALAAAFVLAACFGPMIAVFSEKLSVSRKRGFYAKAGQQTAQMSLFFGILAAALLTTCAAWLIADEPALLEFPYFLPVSVTGSAIGVTIVMLGLYVCMRPEKGPSTAFHTAVGFMAALCSLASLFLCTSMVRRLLHTTPEIDAQLPVLEQLIQFFTIPMDSLFWPLLLEAVPLGFAFAGAFASVWLIIMRGKQDYGRDYYAFALPYCSRWALFATLLAIPAGAYVLLRGETIMLPELSHLPSLLLDGLSLILPLLACGLWLSVIQSEHPMRRKISIFAAWLFLLTGFAGQVLMLNKIIPSP